MKGLTKTTLWEFLELIREKTRNNVMEIKKNSNKISNMERQLFFQEIENPEEIPELKKRNTMLSEENYQLLELHKNIISLGERHMLYSVEDIMGDPEGDAINKEEAVQPSQYVKMALNGTLDYSSDKPWFKDKELVEEIYQALLANERYEDCAKIIQVTDKQIEKDVPETFAMPQKKGIHRLMFWK